MHHVTIPDTLTRSTDAVAAMRTECLLFESACDFYADAKRPSLSDGDHYCLDEHLNELLNAFHLVALCFEAIS